MKRWLQYAKPYKKNFILGPLCMIVESVGEIILPLLLQSIYACVKLLGGSPGTTSSADVWYIIGVSGGMILTALLMLGGGVGGAYFGSKASVNFAADLRADIYAKVQDFSFANIDKFKTGSLVTRLTNDVTQIQNFVNMLVRMCLRAPVMLVGALIMAVILKPSLAAVLLISVPLLLAVQALIIFKAFPRFSGMQGKIDRLNSTVQENLTNVRVVKSFVREDLEKKKFFRANRELKEAGMGAFNIMIFTQPMMTAIMYGTTLAVLLIGGNMVVGTGSLSAEALTTFLTYINQILFSLMMVTMLFMNSSRALASARRIREVLDEEITLTDEGASEKDATVRRGEIEFKNVSFRYYKNREEWVLDDLSFRIEPGETVGIIGSTGCGKTTMISLIPRLYDADEGEILIDGINVRDYSLENLREGVGVVLQKNVLFSGSIGYNLRWGDQEASKEMVEAAAERAQAHGFITSFKDGYDTILAQGGANVSGGQKQRLCIARALLKKPRILILDDSTSAVDTATEKKIRAAFREELGDATKIMIAQRISSVKEADKIIVMNEGRITGIGTHDELLNTNREYREIYESQQDGKGGDDDGENA